MDPNETLRLIDYAIRNRCDHESVDGWCQDLYDWLARGGFKPDWSAHPLGASYYDCRCVTMNKLAPGGAL